MSTLLVENIRHEDASDIAVVLSADGTLGIGTTGTARNDPLTVKGLNNIAKFESSAAAVELRVNTPTVDKIGLTTGTDDNFFINVGGSDRLYVANGGNIGIGTDSPRNKLDVNLNTNRSLNVRVSNDGSVTGTGVASLDPVSGNMRDLVLEGEEVHLATGASGGNSTTPRLSAYAAGGVKVHTNLDIGDKTRFIAAPGSPFDIELQTSDAGDGNFTKVLTIQSGDEFKFWGNGGADEIFRIDNTATYKSQTFGTHNATGYHVNGRAVLPVVNIQRYHMGTGNSTTISSTTGYTNVGNSISYTPKKAGNLLMIDHGVQTWYGSTSNGSGDAYVRFLINGTQVWENERARGNFDADEHRSHHYLRSQFLYTTTGTSAITIQLQGSTSGNVPGGFNFYHTGDNSNQYIITEYEQ